MILSHKLHARDKPRNAVVSNVPFFHYGRAASGKYINPRTAMTVSAVYACVRVIAETMASLPLNVYERTERGRKETDIPLQFILHDEPNKEMTSFQYREAMFTHLLLWGNSYTQTIRNKMGKIISLYPLLPDMMTVTRDDNTNELVYTYTNMSGKSYVLDPDFDVMHIPGLGFDGIIGYSPIALARDSIGLAKSSEEYGGSFFANGARPSGVLTHPGTVKDPARLRQSWENAYGGSNNTGKTIVLEEGMTYHQISIPNSEAQFLETRKFQVEDICRIFRVPPHLIAALDHATFSNIEHQSIEFVEHTIRPWAVRVEQSMNRILFNDAEKKRYYIKFNLDGLLRGDYKSRMEGYAIGRQNGWMSANDIRELEEMNLIPKDEGGDLYLVNGNMIPITGTPTMQGKEDEKSDA